MAYGLIEPYPIEVKNVEIISKDVPASFDGKKIVYISDIHYGPYFSGDRVRSLVAEINNLNPDLILLGGDYIDTEKVDMAPCFAELKNLKAPLGVYGVLGNHDHWGRAEQTREGLIAAGITPLDNTAVWINSGDGRIKLGGVGDLWHDSQNLTPTVGDVSVNDYVILLSHNPDYAEKIKTDKVDLVLSGHTHGGQITFFGLFAPYTNTRYGQKYVSGLVEAPHTLVYVTKGVGTTSIPVRFFARPEITVLELKKI
jgi:predicted MPP superfamily phosphohydrolase